MSFPWEIDHSAWNSHYVLFRIHFTDFLLKEYLTSRNVKIRAIFEISANNAFRYRFPSTDTYSREPPFKSIQSTSMFTLHLVALRYPTQTQNFCADLNISKRYKITNLADILKLKNSSWFRRHTTRGPFECNTFTIEMANMALRFVLLGSWSVVANLEPWFQIKCLTT